MKSFLLVVFCLLLSLHAEDPVSGYDEGEQASPPITVKAYATFLKENPYESNSYQLYHPPMESQLLQVNDPSSAAEESDIPDYIAVDGEEDVPMCGLTDLDVRCYEAWVKKNQPEGTNSESLDESSSPLMVFGFDEKKKIDPKQHEKNQGRNTDYDPSQEVQRGNNGTGVFAGGRYDQRNRMNRANAGLRGPQLIDPTNQLAEIERDLAALARGESLSTKNSSGENVGLLAGHSIQQLKPEPDSSFLPKLRDALSFCFPCLRRTPAAGSEGDVAMAPVTRFYRYGAVATEEPNFSEKLKAVLTNQKFKAGRGAPAEELQTLLNDYSVSNDASRNQMIADLVSDGTISTKDLSQLVSHLKQQPASFNGTQKQTIIQAVIDQRKKEVAEQLGALPLERLHEVDQQVHRQVSGQVALLFPPGSRIGLPTAITTGLAQAPGYSKIQDDALYSTLVKKAVADKTRAIKAAIATNNSTVIPCSVKPTQFLFFLDVDVNTTQVVGRGGFGKVYSAQNRVTQEPLVYKEELRPEGVTQGALHRDIKTTADLLRQGDIAAAALLTLPHFVEAEALIVKVISNDSSEELHYVPAANAGWFIDSLENVKDIQIIGQLMKKAPGKPLRSILNSPEWKALSLTDRLEHFDAIVQQSFEYFSHAYGQNFVHRDIKPENIIYDMATKKLTIIDAGLATKLDVAPTMTQRASLFFAGKSPIGFKTTSEVQAGTTLYLASAIKQGIPHGPEVDAHAFGKVFLELIDPGFSWQLMNAAHQNNEEIKDVQPYRASLASNQQLFGRSPLNNFLGQPNYEKRVALVDAFFKLGAYVDSAENRIVSSWRSTRFENLTKAYAAAYPAATARK
ncbi:MAG: hypothetical protein K2W97_06975 [Chthoniobacterales bacterium]|nr:hypothetical protein [Chthoniobacterales bacterium]